MEDVGEKTSIVIHLKDNTLNFENILSTFFKYGAHHAVEFLVIDNDSKNFTKEILRKYAAKVFIRYMSLSDTTLLAQEFVKSRARYSKIIHINGIEDIQNFLETNYMLPKSQSTEIGISNSEDNQNITNRNETPYDLRQENELLLIQLHQVQEELEEYFFKYQELKSKIGNTQA